MEQVSMQTIGKQTYTVIEDDYTAAMEGMRHLGLRALSTKEVLQGVVRAARSRDHTKTEFWFNLFDTGDGVAYTGKR